MEAIDQTYYTAEEITADGKQLFTLFTGEEILKEGNSKPFNSFGRSRIASSESGSDGSWYSFVLESEDFTLKTSSQPEALIGTIAVLKDEESGLLGLVDFKDGRMLTPYEYTLTESTENAICLYKNDGICHIYQAK